MKRYIKTLVSLTMSLSLIAGGVYMSTAQKTWTETQIEWIEKSGTKGRNATVGAGVGAVGGGVLAAVVGGVGVTLMGTGVGIPAGAALIATAAGLGAGAGAVAGAATGSSGSSDKIETIVTKTAPIFETWQWIVVLALGLLLLVYSFYTWALARSTGVLSSESNNTDGGAD